MMSDMDEYIFDDDGNPIMCPKFPEEEQWFADEEDCKDIFHVKGDGYDVTLSLAKGLISWTNVNPGGKKKGIFKGKSKHSEDRQTIMLRDVFAAELKTKKGQGSDDKAICVGFSLHSVDKFAVSALSERVTLFEHPSEALCSMYCRQIKTYLGKMKRPKSVKLFLQTHGGRKNGGTLYKNRVLNLFHLAEVNVDCVEVQHNEHIKQEMVHINLDDFDCVVAMGGDGTASRLADGLLNSSQKMMNVEQKMGFTPVKARIPLGIIPVGTTNDIARSVMGTEDLTSSVLDIIMGHTMGVDVCSTYSEDKFLQWCFNCQYGFAGSVLTFRKRYKAVGKRGLEPAFVKALTKSKLRAYKCDVEYIPAEKPLPANWKDVPCFQGCDVCWDEAVADPNEVTQDLVQAFDPLAESGDSDTIVDLAEHEDTPWKTVKGDFMNIGLFCITGRSELAPRGLSKFTHLNDGVMDLVLVEETERKEFIRMIKRLGNAKNQFDFPFIKVLRVQEVRFRLRLPTGFNYNDYNYSEIDYEMERRKKQNINNVSKSMEILEIDEFSDSEDLDSDKCSTPTSVQSTSTAKDKSKPMKRSQSFQPHPKKMLQRTNTEQEIKLAELDSEEEDDSEDDSDNDADGSEGPSEIVSVTNGVRHVRSASAEPVKMVGPQYRMTFAEHDRMKRQKRQQKKEMKKKAREEQKMKTVWNMDNEIKEADTINFRVHHGLLRICGRGISPDKVIFDSTLLCIPRM